MRLKSDRGHLCIIVAKSLLYGQSKTGLDEIQAKTYKVKTLRARKHIHNIFETGAPSWHKTLPWQFGNSPLHKL